VDRFNLFHVTQHICHVGLARLIDQAGDITLLLLVMAAAAGAQLTDRPSLIVLASATLYVGTSGAG